MGGQPVEERLDERESSAGWLWWARVPGTLDDREPAVGEPRVERRRGLAERGRRRGPGDLEDRDADGRERVHRHLRRGVGGIELADDRRRRGRPERPDRVGPERREVGRRHPHGLGHEPREERVVVAAGEVGAERLEQLVPFARRAQRGPGRALVRDDPPDRPRPERRAERDPTAQRVAEHVDRPAGLRGERVGHRGEVVQLEADRVRTPSVTRVAAAPAVDRVERVPRRQHRPEDPPRPVIGGRAVDEDERLAPDPAREHGDRASRRTSGRRRDGRRGAEAGIAGSVARASGRSARPGGGPRTARRAARRRGSTPAIVPPWRSAIQRAIARPRPVPPARRVRRPPEPVEHLVEVRRVDPRALVLDGQPRARAGRHRHAATRRGVADRVVDEDRGQLPQPRLVAADRGRHDLEHEPHAALRGHRLERLGRLGRGVARGRCRSSSARPPRRRSARAAAGRRRGAPSGPHPRRGRRSPGRRSPGRRVPAAAPRSRPG